MKVRWVAGLLLAPVGVLLAIGSGGTPGAGERPELAYSSGPTKILHEVAARSPAAVVNELWGRPGDWALVLSNVQSGEEPWLHVAVALLPGTDAGATSELREAVGLALLRTPDSVLHLAVPAFSLDDICSCRMDPLLTYAEALAELESQIASVATVRTGGLLKARDSCLHHLNASRGNLKRFFEVK